MEVSGQLHAPVALPPVKEPLVPLDRGLGGPQTKCNSKPHEIMLKFNETDFLVIRLPLFPAKSVLF